MHGGCGRILGALVLAGGILVGLVIPAFADGGDGYKLPLEQDCRTHESLYDPGKTPEGFEATARIGCHTYHWTSNTTDEEARGTLRFVSSKQVDPWQHNWTGCAGHAAHQANLMANYGTLRVPEGTEITVSYRCW